MVDNILSKDLTMTRETVNVIFVLHYLVMTYPKKR